MLVDFFYVDRLLNLGGVVALDDANYPSVRKLCRFIATNRPAYRVFRCLPPARGVRRMRSRALEWGGRVASRSRLMRGLLKLDLITADAKLGLVVGSRCIAFRKHGADTRRWDAHDEF